MRAAIRCAGCVAPAMTSAAYPSVSAAARSESAGGTIAQAAESAWSAAIASRTTTGALHARARAAASATSPAAAAIPANVHCGDASKPPSQNTATATAATTSPTAIARTGRNIAG